MTLTSTPPARASSTLVEWALLVVPGVIWGASFLFIAEGLEVMEPDGISFLRMVIGFAALSLVPKAHGPVQKSDRMGIFWLGLLWFAFPMSLFPYAEQHVTSALTGMLNGALPLFVAALVAVLTRKLPSTAVLVGLAVGLGGAILMALPGINAGGNSLFGVLLILVALVSYAISLTIARPLQQRNGALPVIWRALAVAVVLTAPLGLPDLLDARWTLRAALSMLALGALGTCVANVVMTVAAGRLGATKASATTFLIPVVALILGMLVRNEQVALVSIAGGGICLLGAWLIRRASMG
jgi:drug/metabolite transporter (DMT)-like permease